MDSLDIENPTYVETVPKCLKCIHIMLKSIFPFSITFFLILFASARNYMGREIDFSPDVIFWIASVLVVLIYFFDGWWIYKEYKFPKALICLKIVLGAFYCIAFINIVNHSHVKSLNSINILRASRRLYAFGHLN